MDEAHGRLMRLPRIAGDTLLTLLAAGYTSLHIYVTTQHGRGSASPWAFGFALLCAASLLVRSRWPLASLIAVGGFGAAFLSIRNDLFPILPAVLIALFSAVAYSHRPRALVWTAAIGVAALLNLMRAGQNFSVDRSLYGLLLDSGWMLIALLLGEALRSRHALAHEAELRAAAAEHTRQEEAQRRVAEERLRIARDLHDVLAHTVALINVQAGVAAHVIDERPDQAKEALVHIKNASRATLQELRALVGVLREGDSPAPLAPAPGLGALHDLVGTARDAGLAVEVEDRRTVDPLPATVDTAAYRILQESLTNAIKHAGRAAVRVVVRQELGALALDVTNGPGDGSPVPIGRGTGHGIVGMRERAAALGGSLDAGPTPDGGFRVRATLPVRGSAA